MDGRLVISGGDGLNVLDHDRAGANGYIHLPGAGALCACDEGVFAASGCGDMIWRLDRNLMPAALFAGGPGMRQLALSRDGTRLYALCTDGNSVLMLDSLSGAPLVLARAGERPGAMALLGNVLAVAGGEAGLFLLAADSLALLSCVKTPGPVLAAALTERCAFALCRCDVMDSVLVCYERGMESGRLCLAGAPGALLVWRGMLLAAVRGWLYAVSPERMQIVSRRHAPGLGGRLLGSGGTCMLIDQLSETAFACTGGGWHKCMQPAFDLCVLREYASSGGGY